MILYPIYFLGLCLHLAWSDGEIDRKEVFGKAPSITYEGDSPNHKLLIDLKGRRYLEHDRVLKYPLLPNWKHRYVKFSSIPSQKIPSIHGNIPPKYSSIPQKYPSIQQEFSSPENFNFPSQPDPLRSRVAQEFSVSFEAQNRPPFRTIGSDVEPRVLPIAQRIRWRHTQFAPYESVEWQLIREARWLVISCATLIIVVVIIVTVLSLRLHCRTREKSSKEWISHPVVQPSTTSANAIQPHLRHFLTSGHLSADPLHLKAKGLLERRGSNTSLTIDLGSVGEGSDTIFSPYKECTPHDYLTNAGNKMSRRQLRKCLNSPKDLHTEFWQIPSNQIEKSTVPGSQDKNRYRTVLPNEDTRVLLNVNHPGEVGIESRYINANYIRGYDEEDKYYIATQGPLANTVEDFWLMVLQERSPAVVQITRILEKNRPKCEPYIPTYSASYGSVNVTVKQVIHKNGYTIRQIQINRGNDIKHNMLHLWFRTWPDHKAPPSVKYLLSMAAEVESARKRDSSKGPIVVHCSAGIGRTGCFIAISIGMNQLLEDGCVDVLHIVCQMRLDRGGMVQTAEQYEFIHRALAYYEASLALNVNSPE